MEMAAPVAVAPVAAAGARRMAMVTGAVTAGRGALVHRADAARATAATAAEDRSAASANLHPQLMLLLQTWPL